MSIAILATDCESTWIVANELAHEFDVADIVIEQPVSRSRFLKRRAKRLGVSAVAGQVAFQVFSRYLHFESRDQKQRIVERNGWKIGVPDSTAVHRVGSVNSPDAIELISRLNVDAIVINGTRILSKRLLGEITLPVINMHAGITPRYRGVHGGYWALARKDEENAGVTVHLVDSGIDTGDVLYQGRFDVSGEDNFATYPLLQLEKGIPLLKNAVRDALGDELRPTAIKDQSELFYHPTIWQYFANRALSKVK